MRVRAHIMVMKGYGCEEHNQAHYAPGLDEEPERNSEYLSHDRDRAVITVEFEVPDSVFKRQLAIEVIGALKP